jgi:hypothetical protein
VCVASQHGVRFKGEMLEPELKLPNAGDVVGRINGFTVSAEGGQSHVVVKFYFSVFVDETSRRKAEGVKKIV